MPRALAFVTLFIGGVGLGWAEDAALLTDHVGKKRAIELERLVRQDCGSCHGMTLRGGLGPDIRAQTLAGNDPEAIKQIILEGVPNTPMPPWRALLTEVEARWIADFLLKGGAQ